MADILHYENWLSWHNHSLCIWLMYLSVAWNETIVGVEKRRVSHKIEGTIRWRATWQQGWSAPDSGDCRMPSPSFMFFNSLFEKVNLIYLSVLNEWKVSWKFLRLFLKFLWCFLFTHCMQVFKRKLEFIAAAKVSSSLPSQTLPEIAFAGIPSSTCFTAQKINLCIVYVIQGQVNMCTNFIIAV